MQELSTEKHMSITSLMRCLSLIGIDAIWQLSLGYLLMRTLASFLRYTGYLKERNGKNLFGSIKNSGEILNRLKSSGFLASGLSIYDFSILYTTLPHNLIKEKFTELIEQTFNRMAHFICFVMIKMLFLLLNNLNEIN